MDKREILKKVQKQVAIRKGLDEHVFDSEKNVIAESHKHFFEIDTFGKQAVITADASIMDWCVKEFSDADHKDLMDGEVLFKIESKMREHGYQLAGEHIRFLYFTDVKVSEPQGFTYKVFMKDQLSALNEYKHFHNALNFKNDVIAMGAYDGDKLVALAGADDYMGDLWQIGIDTLPEYRGRGLGRYLVKTIADEICKQGKVPYYTTWAPNIGSMSVAVGAGFVPAWVGYFAEKIKNDKTKDEVEN